MDNRYITLTQIFECFIDNPLLTTGHLTSLFSLTAWDFHRGLAEKCKSVLSQIIRALN